MNFSFLTQLDQALKNHLANKGRIPRLAIVGIGNEFNGDDAAGLMLVRYLSISLGQTADLLTIEAATSPENFTGPIRRFQPDWIWLIDAAQLNEEPGEIRFVSWDQVDGLSASTHGLPITLFARFVREEIEAEIFLIGIQPETVEAFSPISAKVQESIDRLHRELAGWLAENFPPKS